MTQRRTDPTAKGASPAPIPPTPAVAPEFAQRLAECLRNKASSPEKMNLLALNPARDHFAADWPKLSAKVHSIVEGTLRKFLSDKDAFSAVDDLSYVILCSQHADRNVADVMEKISEEISRRIMGENSKKVFVEINSSDLGSENNNSKSHDKHSAADKGENCSDYSSNIERIINEVVWKEEEFSFSNVKHFIRPMMAPDRRLTNTFVSTPALLDPSRRPRYGYDVLPPEPDTALIAELDALSAENAAKELHVLDKAERQGLLYVPVHRATLSSRKYRELYLKICRALFGRFKNRIIFEIAGIEDGTPSNRVTEHMQWLRPYARAIAATVDINFATMNSFSGASVYSVGVSLDPAEDELIEQKLTKFVPRVRAIDTKCHVHGVKNHMQANLCMSLQINMMDGDAIADLQRHGLELVSDSKATSLRR